MISFGNNSIWPIFLSIVMSHLNKKLLFPIISSFDLTSQAETDTFPLLAVQRGGRSCLKKQWSKRCWDTPGRLWKYCRAGRKGRLNEGALQSLEGSRALL